MKVELVKGRVCKVTNEAIISFEGVTQQQLERIGMMFKNVFPYKHLIITRYKFKIKDLTKTKKLKVAKK